MHVNYGLLCQKGARYLMISGMMRSEESPLSMAILVIGDSDRGNYFEGSVNFVLIFRKQ
jgi:hypothetical protein